MGLVGIWIGPTFAVAFNFFTYLIIWARMDWTELIQESERKRGEDHGKQADHLTKKSTE